MTEKKEQVEPLASLAFRTSSDEDEVLFKHPKHHPRKRFILCCGCLAALLLILVVVILVLIFTVFQIDEPKIWINPVTIQGLEIANGELGNDVNVTLLADVSVKNPNAGSFRITNTTTEIYYGGVMVGEGRHILGVAKARRTLRRNMTVDIIAEKLRAAPTFKTDINSKVLNISSLTRIAGKVKILGISKRNIAVGVNCTMTYNVSSKAFQEQKFPFCRPDF